jgi:hypothetical protein
MNTAAETLLAFWEDPRNIPFKSSLISEEPPGDGKEPTTCMCAQGQALYKIGGYTEDDLRIIEQSKADREVARLLVISVAHSVLLRLINDGQPGAPSDVLTSPEKYLGKNCHAVMKFWWAMDGLSQGQWNEVASRCLALGTGAGGYADFYDTAVYAGFVAVYAGFEAGYFEAGYAAGCATYELIEGIENPVFVPLFADLAS